MRISRMAMNMILLILGIVVAALSIFFASQHFMQIGFEETYNNQMVSMRNVINDRIAETKLRLQQEAVLLSDTRELELAFVLKDIKIMKHFAKIAMQRCKATFATIVDANGIVLARGHSDEVGDTVSSKIIWSALAGNNIVDIVKLKNNGLSIGAASPILINGEVVGAILFGDSFRTNSFVDEVKRITGLEMTVFEGDVRLSTTILRDGKRVVGTRVDNPQISEVVLKEGGLFKDDADILGRNYKTIYWPIVDKSGTTYGMWFIGTEVKGIKEKITAIAISCLLATIIIAVALSCFGILLFRKTINPLEKKAYFDLLTAIPNRAGFEHKIRSHFAVSSNETGALFLLDLDNFKMLNDSLGHPEGDECLKHTGRVLRQLFRENDLVARLGGDEFVIYTPTLVSSQMIREKADTLRSRLTKHYTLPDGEELTVTASIGVAVCQKVGTDFEHLYTLADAALYRSKEDGRNRYTIYECRNENVESCRILHMTAQ